MTLMTVGVVVYHNVKNAIIKFSLTKGGGPVNAQYSRQNVPAVNLHY